ncbi:MAG: NADPH-dependent assimilatory sulfite reductase hemoprotein subunit [Planctomyces sp.]|nr:NADPH-dependent assimilatory sulfite reductase hemoprotein subunit [Planctomyces sp.]
MSDEPKLSKVEHVKEASRQLRGSIAEELAPEFKSLNEDNANLLKHHGSYQQDNRDHRGAEKEFMFMVRTRVPGGKLTAAQTLSELDLCEQYGNGTLRITDRQGFQLHGVLKQDLRSAIKGINDVKLTTLGACGDVNRNVMCCPAPYRNSRVHDEMQALCDALAAHLRPRTSAYYEIWLKPQDDQETEAQKVHEYVCTVPSGPDHVDEEPIYGKVYLPRKFKIGVALPEDNCIDLYSQDLGFLAVVEQDRIVGYNVLVGGSMGMTPANKKTFPAVAKRMAFCTPDQAVAVAEAVVKVQRDYGNRADRKLARLKYLIAERGVPWFKTQVELYSGLQLPEPHPTDVTGVDDHIGWHEQGDGRWFLGINIENGRIKDEGDLRIKTGLRAVLRKYGMDVRNTALQGMILCDIAAEDRNDIDRMLAEHWIKSAEQWTLARRLSIACPAYPTCGLAVTEAERVMPAVMDQIEGLLARHGLLGERIAVHMTGCPNGCARPYAPDIGLVGKARNKYTIYLGGNVACTRLGYLWQDLVPQEEIATRLEPVVARYVSERSAGEAFGDYCFRVGKEALLPG